MCIRDSSKELNPRLGGQDIRTAFMSGDYQLLLVANKFQTGFDEPLLCAMYVDKRLGGIQAVQTLSRLNRCYPGKDQTYVVDFVNDAADILAAFKLYYETAELSGVTDPDIVLTLKAKLDGQALYDAYEVDRVVRVAIKGKSAKQSELDAATTPVASRLLRAYTDVYKRQEMASLVGDIEHRLKPIDELIQAGEGILALMQERRTALISAAVTGKIDVRSMVGHTEPTPA